MLPDSLGSSGNLVVALMSGPWVTRISLFFPVQPVLECAIQKGLVYNKVNPIFHHWRVEERKFGLTFQSPADAISFEKGLQSVLDKLDRGTEGAKDSGQEAGVK